MKRNTCSRAIDQTFSVNTGMRYIRGLLGVVAVLMIVGNASKLQGETIFFDDFSDGSVTNDVPVDRDGNPVIWTPTDAPGIHDATSGDYVFIPVPESGDTISSAVLDVILEDTSVRSRVRVSHTTGHIGITIRNQNRDDSEHYFGGIGYDPAEGGTILFAGRNDGPRRVFFDRQNLPVLPFDIRDEDAILQLDMIGDELRLSGWRAGDPMPAEPQLIAEDGTYASGFVRIYSSTTNTNENIGEFRFVHVADAHILDSSSLLAGDADQDLDFDQLDLVQVQIAAKYLTGEIATWGEGDWDGAPGGIQGNPPGGDRLFNQADIVAALQAGVYLTGLYAAVQPNGEANDGQTSIVYNVGTGELAVDTPAGTELTSINIDSAGGIFTGDSAQNLGGSFDNDADSNIFKATFGSSFGSLSFGNVAERGLAEEFLLNDLSVVGSLQGGGDLGEVDLIYVPEPSSLLLAACGLIGLVALRRLQLRRGLVRCDRKQVR